MSAFLSIQILPSFFREAKSSRHRTTTSTAPLPVLPGAETNAPFSTGLTSSSPQHWICCQQCLVLEREPHSQATCRAQARPQTGMPSSLQPHRQVQSFSYVCPSISPPGEGPLVAFQGSTENGGRKQVPLGMCPDKVVAVPQREWSPSPVTSSLQNPPGHKRPFSYKRPNSGCGWGPPEAKTSVISKRVDEGNTACAVGPRIDLPTPHLSPPQEQPPASRPSLFRVWGTICCVPYCRARSAGECTIGLGISDAHFPSLRPGTTACLMTPNGPCWRAPVVAAGPGAEATDFGLFERSRVAVFMGLAAGEYWGRRAS